MDYSFEHEAYLKGYTAVCGIDEAGRGPLAGPVYALPCGCRRGLVIDGLNDSKKLSEKKREALFDVIKENAVAYGIGFADEKEIDEINIYRRHISPRRAYDQYAESVPDYVLIDGNRMPPCPCRARPSSRAMPKSPSIAAASILAKVSRDRVMLEYAKQYPGYHFEKHKGYGTKVHVEALHEFGPCPIHRKTFLKKILG